MATDPLRHPDLARMGRRLRAQLDGVLEAEQDAARAVQRRRRTLRDILLEAEDRRSVAVVTAGDGLHFRGEVVAVGADHVVLADEGRERCVALDHVISVEVR